MFKFTEIIMYLAPFAVAGALAYTISNLGIEVMKNLLVLLATLYVALIVFTLCVFLPILLIAKIPLKRFWKYSSQPVSIAFGTASSEAALPSNGKYGEIWRISRCGFVCSTDWIKF